MIHNLMRDQSVTKSLQMMWSIERISTQIITVPVLLLAINTRLLRQNALNASNRRANFLWLNFRKSRPWSCHTQVKRKHWHVASPQAVNPPVTSFSLFRTKFISTSLSYQVGPVEVNEAQHSACTIIFGTSATLKACRLLLVDMSGQCLPLTRMSGA